MFKVTITEFRLPAIETDPPIERAAVTVDVLDIGAVIQAATKKPRERRKDAGTQRKGEK